MELRCVRLSQMWGDVAIDVQVPVRRRNLCFAVLAGAT